MDIVTKGILRKEEGKTFIQDNAGTKHYEDQRIWKGYIKHWLDQPVFARLLPQKDYEADQPIAILWPDIPKSKIPYVELYYNERLVKYWASTLGHNALNINGNIYNFSHLLNENEVMTEEEFFYRPALGEFAPSPTTGLFEADENGRAYFDKFGRNFMRTIHVLRVEGIDTDRLKAIFDEKLKMIHAAPVDPQKPEKYKEFNVVTNSCSTIIKIGLKKYGIKRVRGTFPRDLFVSAAVQFQKDKTLKAWLYKMPQLNVAEAQESAMSPLLNPWNKVRVKKLKYVAK